STWGTSKMQRVARIRTSLEMSRFSLPLSGAFPMSSHGQFIWYDLLTPDADGSKRFYSHVVGWGTQPSPGPEPYTMWENNGAPLGGIWPLEKEMGDEPRWLPYVSVDDVDETV